MNGINRKEAFCEKNKVGLMNVLTLIERPGKKPDKAWLMLLLSKVPGPSADLFQKGYVPPKEKTELRMQ